MERLVDIAPEMDKKEKDDFFILVKSQPFGADFVFLMKSAIKDNPSDKKHIHNICGVCMNIFKTSFDKGGIESMQKTIKEIYRALSPPGVEYVQVFAGAEDIQHLNLVK